MNISSYAIWLCLAVLGLVMAIGVNGLQPPQPLGLDAPENTFSGQRAVATLKILLGDESPHPVGSEANRAVRDRLMRLLTELGIEVQLHAAIGCAARRPTCANVENVLAEIPGETRDAIVLMAHYDSVAPAPGAADDGSGVATILEVARVLLLSPVARNRILLVFTDAEEVGLLGAEAFFAEHPWARDVKAVINVEGAGAGGPSLLLRTTHDGGALLRAYRENAEAPVALSVAQEIFARMPNDTDFSVAERSAIPGIDFAFAFGFNHYHTPLDTIENLDPATLQHHGMNVLPLVQSLAKTKLVAGDADSSYYTVQQLFWLAWPASYTVPLAVVALLALMVVGVRLREVVGVGRTLLGLLAAVVVLVVGAAACFGLMLLADFIAGTTPNFPANPWPWRMILYGGCGVAVAAIGWTIRSRLGFWPSFLGVWWLLALLALALAVVAPLAANLVLLPVLAVASLAALLALTHQSTLQQSTIAQAALAIVAASLLGYFLLSFSYTNEETQGLRLAPAMYTCLVIVSLALLPLAPGRLFLGFSGSVVLAGLIWLPFVPLYSAWRPQHIVIYHAQDANSRIAHLAGISPNPIPQRVVDAAGAQGERGHLTPWFSLETENFPAPYAELPVGSSDIVREERQVDILYRAARGTDFMQVVVPASGLEELSVNGHAVTPYGGNELSDFTTFTFYAPSVDEALAIRLVFSDATPVTGYLVDGSNSLPASAADVAASRGELAVPQHRGDQRLTYREVSL